MGLCECIIVDIKDVMKVKDSVWLFMLCLILVVIKDCEIVVCGEGGDEVGLSDVDLMVILLKMVKQCQEFVKVYEEGGWFELVECEQVEIIVI